MPEQPAWLAEEPLPDLEVVAGDIEAWRAALPPEERFAAEYGRPATPEELDRFAPASTEVAEWLQDVAVQTAAVRALADARRIESLLTAFEASIADLTARFGERVADPDGLGGRAFASTMALLTRSDQRTVQREVRAGLVLRDRLPRTWAVFLAGETTWTRAQKVVAQLDGLDEEHWAAYDEHASRIVVASHRVKADLRRQREKLQAATAAARARTTFERRTVTLEVGDDSGAALVVEGLSTTWLPRQEALQRLAVAAHGTDPQHRTVAQLRHDIAERVFDLGLAAFQESAARGAEVVPATTKVQVQLVLTVPVLGWLGVTTEQAVLRGHGPIAMELAKSLAGSATSMIRVMTDPVTGVRLAMDRTTYRPPADLARWVRIRDGRTRFPGRSTPAHLADIDHAREWQHFGGTDDRNLITLDRASHLAKSAGLYTDELQDTGVVNIRDPWGHVFEDPPDAPMDPVPRELLPPPDGDDESCPF
ncbi:uncharacterized protein DUF222 [Amnibacterium kyonggiense]|uniref:Uncharacterized protein DUF222 n=2 Tax=Amnibacterium kyonggiense TaxID=595671 RepID=A0A4R7FKL1_9MICO|nr:uncharacterized protein DUF222 [Amnibacterium kyonggiense]